MQNILTTLARRLKRALRRGHHWQTADHTGNRIECALCGEHHVCVHVVADDGSRSHHWQAVRQGDGSCAAMGGGW